MCENLISWKKIALVDFKEKDSLKEFLIISQNILINFLWIFFYKVKDSYRLKTDIGPVFNDSSFRTDIDQIFGKILVGVLLSTFQQFSLKNNLLIMPQIAHIFLIFSTKLQIMIGLSPSYTSKKVSFSHS